MLQVGGTQYLAAVCPGGGQQPLKVHTGYYVLKLSVTIFLPHLGIKGLKAGRQNNRPYIYFLLLRLLIQDYGVVFTYAFANTTLPLFQVQTRLVDIRHKRDCLREVYVNRFILRYVLIEFIRVFHRTVFYTGGTARAFLLQDIPGLLGKAYLKVSYFSLYTINFSIGENLYIGMPADLDQLGCEYSHGAVIGREGLVKLGHMAPNARRPLDQVNLEASRGKIKGRLNAADSSTDNHYVSKITVSKTPAQLLNVFS
jgi:hypothetical protein